MATEGKVLKILDKYTIVTSLGAEDVKEGDTLMVYALGDEIKDDKGESLGKLEITKAEVEVDHLQPRFSICASPLITEQVSETQPYTSALSYYQNVFSNIGFSSPGTMRTTTREYRKPLLVADPVPEIDRKIKVGDMVRKK
jgi:hypothetical protein